LQAAADKEHILLLNYKANIFSQLKWNR